MTGSSTTATAPAPVAGPGRPDRDALLCRAVLIRTVEERLLDLFAAGELVGTVHTSVGQELSAVTVGDHLRDGDQVFSNHRCHGHYLAATGDVTGLLGEVMGRSAGVCGGRGGSQHLFTGNFLSTGVLGGVVPIAAGAALAESLRGGDGVAVVFLGDGALGEGVLYEVMNVAAVWRLPLLFVLEDNGYAQSTPQAATLAGDPGARAAAFGVATARAGTWDWDWETLWSRAGDAVRHVRDGNGPFLLHVDTYRLRAHSKGDDDRDPAEVAGFERRDPLNRLADDGDPVVTDALARARQVVDEALTAVRAAPPPEPPPATRRDGTPPSWRPARFPEDRRVVDRLHDGLDGMLRANPSATVLGEDVEAPYGGAFKVTRALSERHPGRVRNTPISEAAVTGIGTGLALRGMPCVVEIMFGDFVTLVADQLVNQASKIGFLAGGAAGPDVVVRTPMGGRRGYAPTHSQSLERLFLGTPGLRVLAANELADPAELLARLGEGGCGPTLLVENKTSYGRRVGAGVPHGFRADVSGDRFPVVRVHAGDRADVTLLGYGGMAEHLLAACDVLFAEHDVVAQVVVPTQIHPLDGAALADVLRRAPAAVVAEEGPGFAGFGAEVIARSTEDGNGPVWRRVGPAATCVPAARELEAAALPQAADIVAAAVEAVRHS